jgi:hypothetical protein
MDQMADYQRVLVVLPKPKYTCLNWEYWQTKPWGDGHAVVYVPWTPERHDETPSYDERPDYPRNMAGTTSGQCGPFHGTDII